MTREVIRYKLNELRMMLNDGEHGEEQGILVDIIKELDKAENKGDLISRQAVKNIILGGVSTDTNADKEYVCGLIDNLPSAENKGEWEKIWRTDNMCSEYVCSKCGCGEDYCTEFCPNCGADMRGKA